MASSSWRVLRCALRRSCFSVRVANHRSTKLSQDERFGRRRKVKADDVADLLDEERVGRQLERLGAMRLQRKGAPDAMNAGVNGIEASGAVAGSSRMSTGT